MQEYRNNPSENLNYHYPGMSQRSMVDSFETLTLQDDYDHSTRSTPLCTPRTEPETVEVRSSDSPTEEFEIFVGRLNSQKVDHDLLFRRFSEYGEVLNVHLINKRRTTGIPQDAFAFITYRKHEEACRAIEKENGKAWMGHAIKVAHSVPRCTMAASQKNFHYPPFYGYHHPIPPPVLSSLPASMKQQYEYYAALYSDMNPFVSGPYIQHGQKYGGPIPYFPYHPMFPPFGFLPSYPPVPPSTSSYQNGPTYKSENQRSASEPFAN